MGLNFSLGPIAQQRRIVQQYSIDVYTYPSYIENAGGYITGDVTSDYTGLFSYDVIDYYSDYGTYNGWLTLTTKNPSTSFGGSLPATGPEFTLYFVGNEWVNPPFAGISRYATVLIWITEYPSINYQVEIEQMAINSGTGA